VQDHFGFVNRGLGRRGRREPLFQRVGAHELSQERCLSGPCRAEKERVAESVRFGCRKMTAQVLRPCVLLRLAK
jgi:hypothetical protein